MNPIVNYWGKSLGIGRFSYDIEGNELTSKSKWAPQGQRLSLSDRCRYYADANGDGHINIFDVSTVFKNQGENHGVITLDDCSVAARESDLDVYYSIFIDLPFGELKQSMADIYGFDMPPEKIEVSQNYPNPFNPITTISYAIPQEGNIVIQIYNLVGQKLVDINEIYLYPGHYSYMWNASNYPSGIYYYRIYYNDILIENKKMALIK